MLRLLVSVCAVAVSVFAAAGHGADRLVFTPPADLANGKRIVIVTGDEEYRSEESGPMLAKILSQRHGFHCTVLFAIDKETGAINPNENSNIPGLETLADADLMILGTRWRVLPGEQLQPFLDYLNAGKPLIAFRTATHAFNNKDRFGGYDWQNFGRMVVGENWLNHHGQHKVQGGRGVIVPEHANHPVLNGVADIFTWSDIYGIAHLDQATATVLLRGGVTTSLEPESSHVPGPQNEPMMPLAWIKSYLSPNGTKAGVCFATTAGAAVDFQKEDLRRLFVNAACHLLQLPVPERADVTPVDPFEPSFYGFQEPDYFLRRDLRVSDFALGRSARAILAPLAIAALAAERVAAARAPLPLREHNRIVLLGNGLGERMLHHGHFETELYLRHPEKDLFVRNLCDPGDTPAFRPHPSRSSQWAFPGAAKFRPEFEHHSGVGHYPSPDEWLRELRADVVVAFFGFNESFDGPAGVDAFRAELSAFIDHTRSQIYNGTSAPALALVSPIAFQNLSPTQDLPDGVAENANLARYTAVMREIAEARGVTFIDLFTPTTSWFANTNEPLTVNGAHLNDAGYRRLAPVLADALFGVQPATTSIARESLRQAVLEKNQTWFLDYQMPNGVHAYGRRWKPFGNVNYPEEAEKVRQLTAIRDQAIHALLHGTPFDRAAADANTRPLTPVETNAPERADNAYLYGDDALATFTLAEGYAIQLFASESEFPNLANPAQLSFDNRGRLWVAVLPSYPHYRPGDPLPDDKILIYEDTDGDGRADREIVFADHLNLPIGFELAPEGVYVSQAPNLVLLRDVNGDDRADTREILLSGFDTHDTHHAISAFCADPSGAILMGEGVFLHTNVETAYGPVRGVNGGFYRYTPAQQRLTRHVQTFIPNPWGIAIDDWGQEFFLNTSNPEMHWMLPVEVKARYGQLIIGSPSLIERAHRVRPTSGLEFVSSRHFPAEVQGDYLLNNCIGFLGAKQHSLRDDDSTTGYESAFRQDLFTSSDPNFRPVDLEFAPDGSLYVVDWHNQLIGHMQHSARDPLRDHAHGRIYRITHATNPLVPPTTISGANIDALLAALTLPESRTRDRARRELRGRPVADVLAATERWIAALDRKDARYEHHLVEAMWVTWGVNAIDTALTRTLLTAQAPQARAAAVRAVRHNWRAFPDHLALLMRAANDANGRVRLEAIVAGSWLDNEDGRAIVEAAGAHPLNAWTKHAYQQALVNLGGEVEFAASETETPPFQFSVAEQARWSAGAEIYRREGHCITCHQPDGLGLPAAAFPPLADAEWVTGDPERLIDVTLHGLMGPIEVNGESFPGHVPMTPFHGLLNDDEIAAVLTYVRSAFGNESSPISSEQVRAVRSGSRDRTGFWTAEELAEKYPSD